ncbi:MAG TPA: hypothetical protein VK801_06955, partial [Caulobacteraceae bacterium]|nr:hypothetical protein [Caulobacteraceae bacterium]
MIGPIVDRLIDEVRRIWCYRWLVAGMTATLLTAAVVFTFSAPSTYEAWGQLYVSRQTPLSAAAEGVSLADLGASTTYVVQKTLFNDDSLEAVARALEPHRHLTKFQLGVATAALRKGVRLVDGGDGFVEVHYTDTDPRRAQAVVGLILNRFMSGSYERSHRELQLAGAFLDQQIGYYADQISQSQAKIAALRRRWGVTALEAGEDTVIAAVQPQARAPAAPIQLPPPPLPPQASPPPHTEAGDRVNQLEARLVTLLTVDTEQHPDVIATRRQLEQARVDGQREAAAIPASPRTMAPPAPTPAPARVRRMLVRRRPAPPPEAA